MQLLPTWLDNYLFEYYTVYDEGSAYERLYGVRGRREKVDATRPYSKWPAPKDHAVVLEAEEILSGAG